MTDKNPAATATTGATAAFNGLPAHVWPRNAARGADCSREVALARKLCADKGMRIGLDGVQLLGGHGFVKEFDNERWFRDLRATGVLEGMLLV